MLGLPVSVPTRLHLADPPLPRVRVLGAQVRWSLTGRNQLPRAGEDGRRRLCVPLSGVTTAAACRQPAVELHVVVVVAVRRDLTQRTALAAGRADGDGDDTVRNWQSGTDTKPRWKQINKRTRTW